MTNLLITAVGAGSTTIHAKRRSTGQTVDIAAAVTAAPTGTYFPNRAAGDFVHTDQRAGGTSDIDGHSTDLQAISLVSDPNLYTAWGDNIYDRGGFYLPRIATNVDGAGTRAFAVDYQSFASNYLTNALTTTGLTSVAITQVLGGLGTNGLPQRIVLGWGTANAEEVLVTAYSGGIATLSGTTPTTKTHLVNDPVAIGTEGGYGIIQTYLTTKNGGASTGRTPRHLVISWDEWLGRTQHESDLSLGKGAVGAWIEFNGHIGGGTGDLSGHGVTLANGGNAGHKRLLLLRQAFLERDDLLYEGNSTGGTNAMSDITVHMGASNYTTNGGYAFGVSSNQAFHPDNQKGKWVRQVLEYVAETSTNAGDGIVRYLIDLNDGNGLQTVLETTTGIMGPEYFDSLQINSILNSPYQNQTKYLRNFVVYEPADTTRTAPIPIYGAPTFVSQTAGHITLTVGVPSGGVDTVRFWHCAGNPSGPFTNLANDTAITAGDMSAGTKTITLALAPGTYNIGYSYGLGGKFTVPHGCYTATIT